MDMKVNFAALATASADINTRANGIQSRLDEMDTELQQLVANWEGDAQAAYVAAKADWNQGMIGLREVLTAISGMVTDAQGNYQQMDASNANLFG